MLLASIEVENSVRNWAALRQEAEIHTHLVAEWRPIICPLLGVKPVPGLALGNAPAIAKSVRGDA